MVAAEEQHATWNVPAGEEVVSFTGMMNVPEYATGRKLPGRGFVAFWPGLRGPTFFMQPVLNDVGDKMIWLDCAYKGGAECAQAHKGNCKCRTSKPLQCNDKMTEVPAGATISWYMEKRGALWVAGFNATTGQHDELWINFPSDSSGASSYVTAKNSDRQANEVSLVECHPRVKRTKSKMVQLTYTSIPEVASKKAIIICRPQHMWGAEMGVNENGLSIGNEAIFARVPVPKRGDVLTGMDLVRLGLERAATAKEAVDVITELLEAHVQGGNCGFEKEFYYHNAFAVVDSTEAWTIYTIGKHWMAVRHTRGSIALSNTIDINYVGQLTKYSRDLVPFAISQGWCTSLDDFTIRGCYLAGRSWVLDQFIAAGQTRRCRMNQLLESGLRRGGISVQHVMSSMGDHGARNKPHAELYFLPSQEIQKGPRSTSTNVTVLVECNRGPHGQHDFEDMWTAR
eukprot:gene5490-39_t